MPPRRRTRRQTPRWVADEWEEASAALLHRSKGRCEHCGKDLLGRAERHHRMRRRDGGDRLSNLLLVLPEHHTDIHREPSRSMAYGWIVPAVALSVVLANDLVVPCEDPATVPVLLGDRWWLLDDAGGRHPLP